MILFYERLNFEKFRYDWFDHCHKLLDIIIEFCSEPYFWAQRFIIAFRFKTLPKIEVSSTSKCIRFISNRLNSLDYTRNLSCLTTVICTTNSFCFQDTQTRRVFFRPLGEESTFCVLFSHVVGKVFASGPPVWVQIK